MTATAAAMSLASGEPPINFAAHQLRAGNMAGARDDFEQMLAMLIAAIYPGARSIAANPGDWGIDVLLGELSGLVVIWQSKYFWPLVNRSRQAQIRESFDSALRAAARNGYQVDQWVLCIPSSMDAPTAQWWDKWRARRHRETGVAIELWHEMALRNLLVRPDAAHVRRHFYDPYAPAIFIERGATAACVGLPRLQCHRMSVLRAREAKSITTYGSVRCANLG